MNARKLRTMIGDTLRDVNLNGDVLTLGCAKHTYILGTVGDAILEDVILPSSLPCVIVDVDYKINVHMRRWDESVICLTCIDQYEDTTGLTIIIRSFNNPNSGIMFTIIEGSN